MHLCLKHDFKLIDGISTKISLDASAIFSGGWAYSSTIVCTACQVCMSCPIPKKWFPCDIFVGHLYHIDTFLVLLFDTIVDLKNNLTHSLDFDTYCL